MNLDYGKYILLREGQPITNNLDEGSVGFCRISSTQF